MTQYLATVTHTGLGMPVDELPVRTGDRGAALVYRIVRQPPLPVLLEAHAYLEALAVELGIPVPVVAWFMPKDDAPSDHSYFGWWTDPGDFCDPNPVDGTVLGGMMLPGQPDDDPTFPPTIMVLASVRGDLLQMILAHEMRHLAQPATMTRDEREADAERFGIARVA